MTPAIALEDVWARQDRTDILKGISLRVVPGEILALIGPSGSGKTTVLRIILGLLAPERGVVRLTGEPVSENRQILVPPDRRGLAVVFQDLALWPHLTVEQNLAFGLDLKRTPRATRAERIHHMLTRVGLSDKARRFPGQLSGGERQRVAIARALVLQPHAVLLDEPLTNLDVVLRSELLALLRSLLAETGATALYVTHQIHEAMALDARIAVLEQGRIVAEGVPQLLAAMPPTAFVRALFADRERG
ncbi:MAG: ATP-binding cassette domain-containing protein [Gemmatimonadetes bacterium]|nr:ATP-binding cassette domain-containing protein [Gemmatimonadota bacterium]